MLYKKNLINIFTTGDEQIVLQGRSKFLLLLLEMLRLLKLKAVMTHLSQFEKHTSNALWLHENDAVIIQ